MTTFSLVRNVSNHIGCILMMKLKVINNEWTVDYYEVIVIQWERLWTNGKTLAECTKIIHNLPYQIDDDSGPEFVLK